MPQIKVVRKLKRQIIRGIGGNPTIEYQHVMHAWLRHGCKTNAEKEEIKRRNCGKMPSFFNDEKVMADSIVETINR